jgi:two-component system, NtrC family, sensor histidine kinase KinB
MFGIRQKLSLGFGVLLIIIVLIGIQSIRQLTRLGESIDVILRENYRSVVACQDMKEALERVDSGLLFLLLGFDSEGREAIGKNRLLFEEALHRELTNITLPGEGQRAEVLKALFLQYDSVIQKVADSSSPFHKRRADYFQGALPLFGKIKETADQILRMNQQNMSDANTAARKSAAKAREQMYILVLVGTVVAAGFVIVTGRWILRPINRLTDSAEQIRQGNLELVVRSSSRDEIGKLQQTFNEMASSLRELRRSDQAKLARIQRATEQAFNSLPDAIALIDLEGRVEVATELARDSFGLKQNVRMEDLPFPLVVEMYNHALNTAHTSVPGNEKTIIQQFVKGKERYFQPEAVPILDDMGQSAGVVLVLTDVTQLVEHDEMKKGIISTVSHQLKTPLTSIRMAIHLLLDEKVGTLTPKQMELLVAAQEDSERLHRIIDDLLEIGRIESGRAAMKLQATYPNTLVLDAADAFVLGAHDRGITLQIDLSGDLPEVWADPAQIGHVFSNLISNALRYTEPGGTVTLSAQGDEERVMFKVSDTGRGIPEEYLGKVFDKFFRVPDQGRGTGAGLGLAIVKEIVETHGGTVQVESAVGRGTTFTFTLKRADRISQKENRS